MNQTWTPRRFKPLHMRVCTLYWSGLAFAEVGEAVGLSAEHVRRVVESEPGQALLVELSARTLDTVLDVQTVAQAYAPMAIDEKLRLMLHGRDERVRNIAAGDILAIAGHQPVKRISIERPDPVNEKYKGLTDDELRAHVLAELGVAPEASGVPESETVH